MEAEQKNKLFEEIANKHYPNSESNLNVTNRKHSLLMLMGSVLDPHLCIKKEMPDGSYPLSPDHICFKDGHNMQEHYKFEHQRFAEGVNKCSRCGHEEKWRKDF